MLFVYFCILSYIHLISCDYADYHPDNEQFNNVLACPADKVCIPVDNCGEIASLLKDESLPVHRFRQAVCGYSGTNPKVCCNIPTDVINFNPDTSSNPGMQSQAQKAKAQCGRVFVNSEYVEVGSYPFLARVGFINLNDGSIKYSCTGTIINERTVVTTASCALAESEDYKIHSVLVGEFDTLTNPDCNSLFCAYCTRTLNISYIVKHPSYQQEKFDKNIALLRLNESIDFTLTAQPICYSERQYVSVGSPVVLVGWGKILGARELTEQGVVPMKILPLQDCEDFFNQGLTVEMCAIGRQLPCSGYSGSPLFWRERDCYTLIGMLSYGVSCDLNKNSPSAFVSIQKYARWIAENS